MCPHELDESIHTRITGLCEEGNAFAEAEDFDRALASYRQALALVPRPLNHWEAATWILTALGDVLFQQGNYAEARDLLNEALQCPGGVGNPFIHLRLGQACLELRDDQCARDQLARAYMAGGDEIFDGEDPKYHRYVRSVLRPPRHN